MKITLIVALGIPWVFWGVMMGLLIAAGRSWINLLLIPAGISVVILIASSFASVKSVFWASLILHLFLFVLFLGSYVSFVLKERGKKG